MRKLLVVGLGVGLCFAASGCSRQGPVGAGDAYIPTPITAGITDAYLEIRNNGAADELISAQISIPGTVSLLAPVTPGGASFDTSTGTHTMSMHSVSDIPIPADTTVHLSPNGYHLLITGVSNLQNGRAITLTLRFEHAGTISVVALVTNPESGGSSYFLN